MTFVLLFKFRDGGLCCGAHVAPLRTRDTLGGSMGLPVCRQAWALGPWLASRAAPCPPAGPGVAPSHSMSSRRQVSVSQRPQRVSSARPGLRCPRGCCQGFGAASASPSVPWSLFQSEHQPWALPSPYAAAPKLPLSRSLTRLVSHPLPLGAGLCAAASG